MIRIICLVNGSSNNNSLEFLEIFGVMQDSLNRLERNGSLHWQNDYMVIIENPEEGEELADDKIKSKIIDAEHQAYIDLDIKPFDRKKQDVNAQFMEQVLHIINRYRRKKIYRYRKVYTIYTVDEDEYDIREYEHKYRDGIVHHIYRDVYCEDEITYSAGVFEDESVVLEYELAKNINKLKALLIESITERVAKISYSKGIEYKRYGVIKKSEHTIYPKYPYQTQKNINFTKRITKMIWKEDIEIPYTSDSLECEGKQEQALEHIDAVVSLDNIQWSCQDQFSKKVQGI